MTKDELERRVLDWLDSLPIEVEHTDEELAEAASIITEGLSILRDFFWGVK